MPCEFESCNYTVIEIYKGTMKTIKVEFKINDTPYIMQEGDKLIMTVKQNQQEPDANILLQKESANGEFVITAKDIKDMDSDQYIYDIQLLQVGETDPIMIIEPQQFIIKNGVRHGI